MRSLLLVLAVAGLAAAAASAAPPMLPQVDVSQAPGQQAEVAVAVDPQDDRVLLAGSNSLDDPASAGFSRVYSSTDGGATWSSAPGPAALPAAGARRCSYGDPAVAIGRGSRQYYAFLSGPCDLGPATFEWAPPRVSLEVASRTGPSGAWRTAAVFPARSFRFDDKPAIAVDASPTSPYVDRVYAAWSRSTPGNPRRHVPATKRLVVSSSTDGGATWSRPLALTGSDSLAIFASLAVDRSGAVYVAWTDFVRRIWLDRSTDGGATFGPPVRVDAAGGPLATPCGNGLPIPAQARRCITPVPQVTLDDGPGRPERVYVTYGGAGSNGREQDVFVSSFDGSLGSPSGRRQVNPPDGAVASDQFLPAAAVDPASGRLWVCYYDTAGDPLRRSAFYTCTASTDGGATWAAPVRAASVASDMSGPRGSDFQFGDYEGLAVADGVAHPIWTDGRDLATLRAEIYTTALTAADLQPAQ